MTTSFVTLLFWIFSVAQAQGLVGKILKTQKSPDIEQLQLHHEELAELHTACWRQTQKRTPPSECFRWLKLARQTGRLMDKEYDQQNLRFTRLCLRWAGNVSATTSIKALPPDCILRVKEILLRRRYKAEEQAGPLFESDLGHAFHSATGDTTL